MQYTQLQYFLLALASWDAGEAVGETLDPAQSTANCDASQVSSLARAERVTEIDRLRYWLGFVT